MRANSRSHGAHRNRWSKPVSRFVRAIRNGRLATVTDTVKRVLGRKPITFDQWVQENIAVFADPVYAV
jgi:hypothetical protein